MSMPLIKLIKSLTNEWKHQNMGLICHAVKPTKPPHSAQPQYKSNKYNCLAGNSDYLLVARQL